MKNAAHSLFNNVEINPFNFCVVCPRLIFFILCKIAIVVITTIIIKPQYSFSFIDNNYFYISFVVALHSSVSYRFEIAASTEPEFDCV